MKIGTTEQLYAPKSDAKEVAQPTRWGLLEFLSPFLAVLWKDWPKNMEISSFNPLDGRFVLTGECPHGPHTAAFIPVTNSYKDERLLRDRWIAALQCVSCNKFILGIVGMVPQGDGTSTLNYLQHYPVGEPDDSVSEDVPDGVMEDFREALRCRWVKAYHATVEMCRRAIQSSCDDLKAGGKTLFHQIDDLSANGIITQPLRDLAHKIRLGGNRGAHPPDILDEKDADAVISFTRHYLDHVYVMPAAMAKVNFSKQGGTPKP